MGPSYAGDKGEVIAQMEDLYEVRPKVRFLKEAKAVWDFEKSLGIGYDGDERVVISKIAPIEEIGEARFRAMLAEEGK